MAEEAHMLKAPFAAANGSSSTTAANGSPNMSWKLAKKALIQASGPAADGEPGTSAGGSLEGADPELCITLLERGLNFTGLKARLKAADQTWIEHFISIGGIPALFDALEALGKKGFSSIMDAIRQLECVGCVRAVMNNRFGLEYIVETTGETFVRKLTEGIALRDASLLQRLVATDMQALSITVVIKLFSVLRLRGFSGREGGAGEPAAQMELVPARSLSVCDSHSFA